MKREEDLIAIYKDTEQHFDSYPIPVCLKHENLYREPVITMKNVSVINEDCIETAQRFSNIGATCLLNMASFKKPGGGVKAGRVSQEEEIARRSNLMVSLDERYYPMKMMEYIYSHRVIFFKNRNYQLMNNEFECDVISVAAVDLKEFDLAGSGKDLYEAIMRVKIETILTEPAKNGVRNLVLSAFGCGVFKNDPEIVSRLFKEALQTGHARRYDNIAFAILNDKNASRDNYRIFKETFK